MKTSNLKLTPLLLAFMALPVLAEAPAEFSEVDADADGILSTAEAKEALPDLAITDMNGDGLVNPAEVEAAVPGLMLSTAEDKATAYVTEAEYQLIVAAIEESDGESGLDDFG
jgi:hypothetical protein